MTTNETLKKLRDFAAFKNARFDNIFESDSNPLPKSEAEVDAFVKERTRLYMESWVLPLIDGLIEDHKKIRSPANALLLECLAGILQKIENGKLRACDLNICGVPRPNNSATEYLRDEIRATLVKATRASAGR